MSNKRGGNIENIKVVCAKKLRSQVFWLNQERLLKFFKWQICRLKWNSLFVTLNKQLPFSLIFLIKNAGLDQIWILSDLKIHFLVFRVREFCWQTQQSHFPPNFVIGKKKMRAVICYWPKKWRQLFVFV